MHMFDIDVPGGIRFQESEVLNPGNGFLTFDTGTVYSAHFKPTMSCCYNAGSNYWHRVVQSWSRDLL